MNRLVIKTALALFSLLGGLLSAQACESYKSLATSEMKEFRDKLSEAEADPLDRLFAFEELSCSDNPTVRAYAVREGLKTAKDQLVREQIVLTALMQKTRLDIELVASGNVTDEDRKFIKKHAGLWSLPINFRSQKDGCVSAYHDSRCDARYSLFLRGDKAEFTYDRVVGEFQLSEDNALVGFVRVDARDTFGRIPAVINLF